MRTSLPLRRNLHACSSYPVELLALVTGLTGVLEVTCNQPNLHPAAAVKSGNALGTYQGLQDRSSICHL